MAGNDMRLNGVRNEKEQLGAEETANERPVPQKADYKPVELRKPLLISYCAFILIIFALLQLIAAAYSGAPNIGYLVPRSAQSSCPAGATCAPARGSWSDPTVRREPSNGPGAPASGSYTDSTTQSKGWGTGYYFVGGYLPTLAAILLSTWWKCVFSKLKEMEPVYQLSKTTRISAAVKDAMTLPYTSAALPKVFFGSLSRQHWLTWIGSVNMILLYICTAFASETVYISTTGSACRVIDHPTGSTNKYCQMHLSIRRELAWAIGGILFTIFVFTVILIIRLQRQVSGIFAEISSIIGIAGVYKNLLVKGLIHPHGTTSGSVLKDDGNIETFEIPSATYGNPFAQPAPVQQSDRKQQHSSVYPVSIILFWFYLVAVLVLILYYRFVSKPGTNNKFEDFMNSQSFGVKFFMTCVGLTIKMYWGAIEKHLRSIAPYIAMSSENGAMADTSVLIRTPSHPIVGLTYGSSWRSPLLGLVTISAVLSEVLVITLNTVPFSVSTAYLAFELSVYISTGIITIMVITIPLILIRQVRSKRKMSGKAPECIAEVVAMLNEDLCGTFGNLNEFDGAQRDQIVRSWNCRYFLKGQSQSGVQRRRIVAYRFDQVEI